MPELAGHRLHRDDYTVRDALDRRALVRDIARTVAEDVPPLVFGGIHQAHVVTVWFEAWRYQNEPAPVVPLIQEMRRQLSAFAKLRNEAEKIGSVTASALLDCIDKAAKLIGLESSPVSAQRVQAIGEQWEKDHFAASLPTDSIQTYLAEAIAGLLPRQREGFATPRIVVFIDDLDRCSGDAAYRLLEGLKIYLCLSNCVFVLGMNQKVICEAIAERLKRDELDTAVLLKAEAYLEKLCGNIWRLPLPTEPVRHFIELVEDEAAGASIAAVLAGPPALPSFLPPNPRRLRALANVYNRLRNAVAPDAYTSDLNLRALVVAYVYQFHPELFQRLALRPQLPAAHPRVAHERPGQQGAGTAFRAPHPAHAAAGRPHAGDAQGDRPREPLPRPVGAGRVLDRAAAAAPAQQRPADRVPGAARAARLSRRRLKTR